MKKLFSLLASSLFMASPFVAFADNDGQTPPPPPPPPKDEIVFGKPLPDPDPGKIHPRGLVPISGLYADGVLMIDFAVDFGSVSVTIVNTTTGEMWFESGDSASGTISIAVAPLSGNYLVTVETQTDGVYIGEFIL